MKALKGLLIYIGIVLGVILGIGIILFALMYFVPTFKIFGYGIVRQNSTVSETVLDLSELEDYDDIVINVNSNSLNLGIIPKEDVVTDKKKDDNYLNEIDCSLQLSVFGFTNDITEYAFNHTFTEKNGTITLNINVTEPKGLISASKSKLSVYVPNNLTYKLNCITDSGSISLGNKNYKLDVSSLTITTNRGDLSLINMTDEEGVISLDNLNLTSEVGLFDLTALPIIEVKNATVLAGKDADFRFANLRSSVVAKGEGVAIKATSIECGDDGFRVVADNAYINIEILQTKDIAENSIVADNADIHISKVSGETSILTTYGTVELGEVDNKCDIESSDADVTVGVAHDNISVLTKMGNIIVTNYEKSGNFVSDKGDINITNDSAYSEGVTTNIVGTDGRITVINKANKLTLSTKGDAIVDITFKEIANSPIEHSVILHERSSAVVYLPSNNYTSPFKFIAKGTISGQISGATGGAYITSSDEPQYYPSASPEVIESSANNCSFIFNGTIEFRGHLY